MLGQTYQDWHHLFHTLQQRQVFLNNHLPCRSLQDQPPLVAFPRAHHSTRSYRPEWEADLIDLQRVWHYLAQAKWYRRVSSGGTIMVAQQAYFVGNRWSRQDVEVTFNPDQQHLLCFDDSGHLINSKPIQGISVSQLMGHLAHHFNLPRFQLALPFDKETFNVT